MHANAGFHRLTVRVLLLGVLTGHAFSAEPVSVIAPTGPPSIVEHKGVPVFLYRQDEFEAATKYEGGHRTGKLPASGRGATVRLGIVRTGQAAVTLAVFQHEGETCVVVDTNQNSDLDDDPVLVLERGENDWLFSQSFRLGDLPTRVSAVVSSSGEVDRLFVHLNTERHGHVPLDGRSVRFALLGFLGRYDAPHNVVYFDLDGDGELNMSGLNSSERFAVREQFVTIDGTSYEFDVDGNGDSLALTEMPSVQSRRTDLNVGALAPDFAFVDAMDGASRTLSSYKGKVVLLYGWGTWCRPCKDELPYLLKAYEVFADKGFEIIGVNKGDVKGDVLAYTDHHKMGWPQALQGKDGHILELYRMEAFPATVLVDESGRIAGRGLRGEDLLEELTNRLDRIEATE